MTECPSTVETIRSLLREMAEYGRDLVRLFALELGEKSRSLRIIAGMAGAAALLLSVSFLLLTGALVGAVSFGLDSWRWALLIVGIGYGLVGLLLLLPLASGLRQGLLRFDHTRDHLRNDPIWVKRQLAAEPGQTANGDARRVA